MPFSDYNNLKIAFQTWRQTYVRADDRGSNPGVDQSSGNTIGDWEKWDVYIQSDGTVSFKGAHGKYMRADNGGGVNQTDTIGAWEKWTPNEIVPGVYSFKGAFGYLRAGNDGYMNQTQTVGPWEKFTLQVVSDCLEVYDFVYAINQAVIANTQPKAIQGQTMSNNSDTPQTMSIQFSPTYQTSSTWTQTVGLTIGEKIGFKAGLPLIAEATVEISVESKHEWSSGKEIMESQQFSATLNMEVPAKSRCSSRVNFSESNLNIPWTAKAAWRGVTGANTVTQISGTWSGTSVWDVHYTIDAPVHL